MPLETASAQMKTSHKRGASLEGVFFGCGMVGGVMGMIDYSVRCDTECKMDINSFSQRHRETKNTENSISRFSEVSVSL